MAVRLMLAFLAQKRVIPNFTHVVRRVHEKFSSRRFGASYWLLDSFWPLSPKTLDSYFLDMMYVEFMKNYLLADSNELLAVRLILASWAQKRWKTLLSRHVIRRVHKKLFFLPIRASCWLLDSFRLPEPKNVWFLLSRHDVRGSSWKIFCSPISSELLAVRLILASWPRKRLIATF